MKTKLILSFLFVEIAISAFAFDAIGHRIIADIAYENLNCRTRKNVDRILGKRGMIYLSTWADEVRSDKSYAYSYNWHFQNLKDNMSQAELKFLLNNPKSEGEHLFFALDSLFQVRKKDNTNTEALKFLVHFVGDLFQPMHLGREEDLGGNTIYVSWFCRDIRLHQLWDTQIFELQKMSYAEYSQYIRDKFAHEKKKFQKQTLTEAIWETYKLREKIYAYDYTNLNAYNYMYQFNDDIDSRLFSAGIQLANVLNNPSFRSLLEE
ncbi:MAG: S1/P1 nuclease [Paludibacteraceae bacterium]